MKNQWIEKRKNKNAKQTDNLTLLNLFSIEGLCNDSESNELSICSGEIELKTEDENFLNCISLLRVGTLHGAFKLKMACKEKNQITENIEILVWDKIEMISTKLINGKIFVLKFKKVT